MEFSGHTRSTCEGVWALERLLQSSAEDQRSILVLESVPILQALWDARDLRNKNVKTQQPRIISVVLFLQ